MAETTSNEMKLSLKLMVDVKAKKVLFAEADKAFVDFIFSLMSLPIATVTKILLENKKGMLGSLCFLYQSIESLTAQYWNINSESVLMPKSSVAIPLLSPTYEPAPSTGKIYKCAKNRHISDSQFVLCPCPCLPVMQATDYTYIAQDKASNSGGYVKEWVYMVMDNLEVKPMSISLIKSYVTDFDFLEEKHVEVGLHEGLALLKATLETEDVLTTIFIGNKSKTRRLA